MNFDLADGRRKEKLQEQQVANAAVAHVALNQQQQILGQQLAALNDPLALQRLAAARGGYTPGGTTPLAFPFGMPFQGAVGYQPVITSLPEGANMAATAVISADRRYVRITCVPLFSGVSQVHTFNTVSGQTSNVQGQGTGGQGFSQVFQTRAAKTATSTKAAAAAPADSAV